jgi:hypothetical protein
VYCKSSGAINFYDGIIEGKESQSIYGTIADIEEDYDVQKYKNGESEEYEVESGNEITILKQNEVAIVKSTGKKYTSLEKALADTSDEDTITIIYNTTIIATKESLEISSEKNITLDLAGYTITTNNKNTFVNSGNLTIIDSSEEQTGIINSTSGTIIKNNEEGTLKIESGILSYIGSSSIYIINNYGNLKMSGGTIALSNSYSYGINNEGEGTIEVTGGTITSSSSSTYGIYNAGTGTVKISEGTIKTGFPVFNSNTGTIEVTGGTIYGNCQYGIRNTGTGTIKITGGTIKNYTGDGLYIREYYSAVCNESTGIIEITGGTIIGNTSGIYNNTGTVKISGDPIISSGNNYGYYGIYNAGTGTVEITGGTITGERYVIYNYSGTITIGEKDGKVSAESPKISGSAYGIYNYSNGTINIYNGTIESTGTSSYGIYNYGTGTVTLGVNEGGIPSKEVPKVTGTVYGVYNNTSATFNFYDGLVTGSTAAIYGVVTNVPEEYNVVYLDDDETTAVLGIVADFENLILVNNTYYDSIETAIAIISNSTSKTNTIQLCNNLILQKPITIPEGTNITLALEGHIISYEGEDATITNNGTLNIVDYANVEDSDSSTLSVVQNTKGVAISNNGTLVIGQANNPNENSPQIKGNPAINGNTYEKNSGTIENISGESNIAYEMVGANLRKFAVASILSNNLVLSKSPRMTASTTEWTNENVGIGMEADIIPVLNLYVEDYVPTSNYTVNYLEKDTNNVLQEAKVVEDVEVDSTINLADEIISITGYNYDSSNTENITIVADESSNVINLYYVKAKFGYTVEYYYNNVKDDSKTVTSTADYLSEINTYEDKVIEDYELEKTENLPLSIGTNAEDNVIKVYYKQTISQVTIKCIDKITGEEIDEEIIKGKIGEEYTVSAKEIEGYTVVEVPEELTGTYTNEAQEKTFYYAKNAAVKVKYLEKDSTPDDISDNLSLADEETISGYEGKEYETSSKEIENYELLDIPANATGTMQVTVNEDGTINAETIVIYYYLQKTKVTVNYIDIISDDVLDLETTQGLVGDVYSSKAKDFDGYVLVEEDSEGNSKLPTNAEGTMTKDEIVVNYYYKHISAGVIEKHIDKVSGEILSNTSYEGNEGDVYSTSSKEFDGYDLVEQDSEGSSMLPANATGTMTQDLIEVKYYYIRKATVKVQYIDINTNEEIAKAEVIEGHQGDEYTTTAKEIEGYALVETDSEENSLLSTNAEGTMQVTLNDDGTANTEIVVKYNYAQKTKVTVNYIDIICNDVLDTEVAEGLVGDAYSSKAKDFEGYVLVETDSEGNSLLPANATGTMIKDEIVINYYYKHISVGVVEKHIDKISGAILESTIYEGNEGDAYSTSSKDFEGYDLVEEDEEGNSMLPENATGTMTTELIEVKYYYIRKASVKVQYIDVNTNEEIAEAEVIEGHQGDEYTTSSKEIENYELLEIPANANGTMQVTVNEDSTINADTVVIYNYSQRTKVTVNYIDIISNDVLDTEVSEGLVGDAYTSKAKDFEGYVFVEKDSEGNSLLPENSSGTMTKDEIIINYYYKHISAGVIEKHIDILSGEILDNTVYEGNEGDPYETSSKDFKDYDLLLEDKEGNSILPENASGTMTQDLIEVKYYYIRKATVRVQYVDNSTGEKISEDLIINGYENDYYKVESKEIENYTLLETDSEGNNKLPANAEGTMQVTVNEDGTAETEIVVTYYYEKVKEPESPVEPDKPTTPENPDDNNEPEKPDDNNKPENTTNTNTNTTNTINTNNTNTNNTNTNNTNNTNTNTNNTNTNNTNTNNTNNANTNNSTNNDNSNNDNSNNNSNASSNNNDKVTIIKTYIQNSSTNNNVNNNANNTSNTTQTTKVLPSTGDVLPVVAIGTIILVIIANIAQIVISRRKKK